MGIQKHLLGLLGWKQEEPALAGVKLRRDMEGSKGISTGTSAAEAGLFLDGLGSTVRKDTENTKGLSASFVSAFTSKVCSWASQVSAPRELQHGPSAHEMQPWRGAVLGLLTGCRYLKTQQWPDLTRHKL